MRCEVCGGTGGASGCGGDSGYESEPCHFGPYEVEIPNTPEIVNCTPHVLNIIKTDGSVVNLEPSGICPRVTATTKTEMEIGGVAISKTVYGDVVGLPDPKKNVYLVVSRLVLQAVALPRPDLLAPGELVRGSDGQPVGCKGLSR